jgi:hypothetical protein
LPRVIGQGRDAFVRAPATKIVIANEKIRDSSFSSFPHLFFLFFLIIF